MRRTSLLLTMSLVAVSAVGVGAHGIWFAQRAGQLAMIYGEGAEDGEIVKRLPGVRSIAGFDADGVEVPTKLIPTDHLLFVDVQQKPAVIAGALDNGLWTVGPDNREVNKGKNEVRGAKSSGHYFKYAVHLRGDLKKPLGPLPGQALQLTPVTTVLPRRIGDAITLRALFQGRPLAGAEVIADFVNDPDAAPLRTDRDGRITLKIRNQGL